jgi:glycosyltransferase involved in cell wall biosynthesis
MVTRPGGFIRGLTKALRLGRLSARETVYSLAYFVEAVMAGRWLLGAGVGHFHVHYSSTVGLLVTRIFPLEMSMTLHGRAEFVDPRGFHLAEKVARSSFVRAISQFSKSRIVMAVEDASEWGKIEVAHLGVDPEELGPRAFREAPARFEILSVGQLVPIKAHWVLLEAMKRVLAEGWPVRLTLVGDGDQRANLERLARELAIGPHVVFAGQLNHEAVRALYRETDVFVLSSLDEGVPVVLMEAMAMEIPCVATQVAGIPELVRPGIEGLLAAPSDAEGLAEAVVALMRDPGLRRRFGVAGRARVVECFNLRKNCEMLAGIFRSRLG